MDTQMSALEEIRLRYANVERVVDAFGRTITVKRLNPANRLRVRQLAETNNELVVGALTFAASVVAIGAWR